MVAEPSLFYQAARGYAAVGLVVAAAFLAVGLGRVDGGAHGAFAFRPLLLPGLVLLWPVVLWRWWRLARLPVARVRLGRRYRATHRGVWTAFAVLLPLALLGALVLRQHGPLDAEPLRLAAPTP